MKRRDFLTGTIFAGTTGILLDACAPGGVEKAIPILIPEEDFIPGVEQWKPGTCFECPGGCGLLVRKIDGRIVKVDGNPVHPVSRGGSCARGQALPQSLYHPDRLATPLVRDGERGAGPWKEIAWEDALERLASSLAELREDDAGESLAFLTGALRGHRQKIVQRFLSVFGSSRHLVHEPFSDDALVEANRLSVGVEGFVSYDVANARYCVNFGAALIDGSRSPVRFSRAIAHMKQGRPGIRGKLVTVEPRLSMTGANADEWLPARPGSEAAVALGLAHVLLREELYDEAFVRERASQLEAFRELVLSRYSPEAVAEIADVPAGSIERIAREMAANRPAVVIAGDGAVSGANGLSTALAVSHLNALLGSFGQVGGIFFDPEPPFADWPPVPGAMAGTPEPLRGHLDALAETRVLLVSGTNPLYSLPPSSGLADAWARIPFIASFTSFMDETAEGADLILPESTPLERFDDDVPSGAGIPAASLSGPLLARSLYDTRSMPDVLIEVASRFEDLAPAFPWGSYEEALRAAWAGIQEVGSGSVVEPTLSGFWNKALEQGGWWDESYDRRAELRTSDGRYRFELAGLDTTGVESSSEEYPLRLVAHVSPALGDGRSAHLPHLQELGDPMTGVRWGSALEIASETAAEHGIHSGDSVEISSPHGSLRVPAHVSPTLRPDVVAMATGQGHTAYGRYASGRGASVFRLLDAGDAPAPVPVRIRKVGT